jgi:hypothetical protein
LRLIFFFLFQSKRKLDLQEQSATPKKIPEVDKPHADVTPKKTPDEDKPQADEEDELPDANIVLALHRKFPKTLGATKSKVRDSYLSFCFACFWANPAACRRIRGRSV